MWYIVIFSCSMFPTGTYECGFTNGSVRHTAKANLSVALLPDVITMTTKPLIADCIKKQSSSVTVKATVLSSKENYTVTWTATGATTGATTTATNNFTCKTNNID